MELVERIRSQVETVHRPLFAVTLTALPRPNTPVLLVLHWHAFAPAPRPGQRLPGETPTAPLPSSALQVNDPWDDPAHWDGSMLDSAWQLGAWELDREERRACTTVGAGDGEAIDCRRAFADNDYTGYGLQAGEWFVNDAPDRAALLQLGARIGYVHWRFRPVRGGFWPAPADDVTLDALGGRQPPCPHRIKTMVGTKVSRVRYHLGRSNSILRAI